MELRYLATFRAVARSLSFTKAAAELGYVQSAVTAHVKALESELGVRLFDRLGRRVNLTAAGEELLPYARRMLDLSGEAAEALSGDGRPSGTVTVSTSETLAAHRLPGAVQELGENYPEVRISFRPNHTGALDADLERALREGEVELAFVLDEKISSANDLLVETLLEEPLAVVASPNHPLSEAPGVRPEDLDGASVLLTEKGCGFRRVFERVLSDSGARPRVAAEFTSSEAIKRCAEAGMGVAVLAEVSVARELEEGRLSALGWEGPDLRVTTYMAWHRDRWISPALAAVMQTARQALRPLMHN